MIESAFKTGGGVLLGLLALSVYAILGAVSLGTAAVVVGGGAYLLGVVGLGGAQTVFLGILGAGALLGVVVGILHGILLGGIHR